MIPTRQILGIQFNGNVDEALGLMLQRGGFLVAPSGLLLRDSVLTAHSDVGQSDNDVDG
jgi:hypothetical protein